MGHHYPGAIASCISRDRGTKKRPAPAGRFVAVERL
jgi:hypothetical protein